MSKPNQSSLPSSEGHYKKAIFYALGALAGVFTATLCPIMGWIVSFWNLTFGFIHVRFGDIIRNEVQNES